MFNCAKFETGQTLIFLQMDATTSNIAGQQCWELLRPFARSLIVNQSVNQSIYLSISEPDNTSVSNQRDSQPSHSFIQTILQ